MFVLVRGRRLRILLRLDGEVELACLIIVEEVNDSVDIDCYVLILLLVDQLYFLSSLIRDDYPQRRA